MVTRCAWFWKHHRAAWTKICAMHPVSCQPCILNKTLKGLSPEKDQAPAPNPSTNPADSTPSTVPRAPTSPPASSKRRSKRTQTNSNAAASTRPNEAREYR